MFGELLCENGGESFSCGPYGVPVRDPRTSQMMAQICTHHAPLLVL